MDEETNDMEQPKVDDLSLPEAVEVDKIIDFYKDKISETEDVTDDTPKEPSKSEHFLYEFANKLPFCGNLFVKYIQFIRLGFDFRSQGCLRVVNICNTVQLIFFAFIGAF